MLLAIDTSTRYAGVALVSNDGHITQLMQWHSRQNHTRELIPAIDSILEREEISFENVTGIAVAIGPGSFSALRVGLSVAKGLAWSNNIPLVTATTFEAEAFTYNISEIPVCAILDAGRDQLAWATFNNKDDYAKNLEDGEICDSEKLFDVINNHVLLCGEGLERHEESLSSMAPPSIKLATPYIPSHRISALAALCHARFKSKMLKDPSAVQPLYLRKPTINTAKRR
jgi:tRNA threonylcarbamoyladenosine biosynthesis protein TsaB